MFTIGSNRFVDLNAYRFNDSFEFYINENNYLKNPSTCIISSLGV
jgi:hypothetical protein